MTAYKRLPVKGIPNLRDLGGWPTPEGVTKQGVFLRSALPRELDRDSAGFLLDYGLAAVVDFRSAAECERAPDALGAVPEIEYIHMPMFDAAAAGGALKIQPGEDFTWGEHYIRMAQERKDWIGRTMTLLSRTEGCTLFHCTTGKDRAGLISALILAVCGVCTEDIAADYCVSQVYLREMYAAMESDQQLCGGDIDAPFYRTDPSNIRAFLEYIECRYGSAAEYLENCGVDRENILLLRQKLIQKI